MKVLIKGAGDLASGVAARLFSCGFDIVMSEIAQPTTVRTTVAFSSAVVFGSAKVEGIEAVLAKKISEIDEILNSRKIAVIVDPNCEILKNAKFDVVVDGILAKKNLGTTKNDANIVVALGPGFSAGNDCHAVVETKRGHYLGKVIWRGRAIENTGIPGIIGGFTSERIIRAKKDGIFVPKRKIGDIVKRGDIVAESGGAEIRAEIDGVVRGMLFADTPVVAGMKCGDIDPRGEVEYCKTISDKARAIAGGVLEAILSSSNARKYQIA